MELSLKQAIAKVEVETGLDGKSRGKAFHVFNPYVLTAYHVIADRNRFKKKKGNPLQYLWPGPIKLHFMFCSPPFPPTEAQVHENYLDPFQDWALLKCSNPPP